MGTTGQLAAATSRLAAVTVDDMSLSSPETKEDAIQAAVEAIYLAAKALKIAEELAEEEEPVALFTMARDTLENMAAVLIPDGHGWSQIGAELYEFPSGKRLNG